MQFYSMTGNLTKKEIEFKGFYEKDGNKIVGKLISPEIISFDGIMKENHLIIVIENTDSDVVLLTTSFADIVRYEDEIPFFGYVYHHGAILSEEVCITVQPVPEEKVFNSIFE